MAGRCSPASCFLWRGDAYAPEEGVEGDIDAFGEVAEHFFCVEVDDAHLAIEDLVGEEAGLTDGVIAVRDGEVDGGEADFEDGRRVLLLPRR